MTPAAAHSLSRPECAALRAYGTTIVLVNLAWETAQLPLYTLWETGTSGEIAFAVLHCTVGDLLIASFALGLAILLSGGRHSIRRPVRIGLLTVCLALAYTLFSEWLNTEIRQSWAYAPTMPVLPGLGTGLLPTAQWLLVPPLALWQAHRTLARVRPD